LAACVRTESGTLAIHNRQDFHPFAAFREANGLTAALRGRKCGIDATLAFVDRPFVAQEKHDRTYRDEPSGRQLF
jgi:hypothetical protein